MAHLGGQSGRSGPAPAPGAGSVNTSDWLFAGILVLAVFLAYQPAWQGGFIWDDDKHVTSPELRSLHGLYRIWFDIAATQQYYPLSHSAFWVQHKLWGDTTLGYHLVNILLHSFSALLVGLILRRLAIPGAWLAAAVFALHPVHVESVAWIMELKNTLSGAVYLAAMLVYLRFDQTRGRSLWVGALGLFLLALLSKTVTATLPAALLVIFWWQRGRLSWKKDILPLSPFFLVGASAGIFTAWVERTMIGAQGSDFQLTLIERCLVAGRATWFYMGKILWPADLLFIYQRWTVSQAVWWQYLFPAAVLLLLVVLLLMRRRWRGPLAGLLFFVGTLFPALGFFNVYPFVFSFVADHFQYLASLGVIVLVSAGAGLLMDRWRPWSRRIGVALCLVLLAVLGCLTWRQSRMYTDIKTLYRTTIDRNPACWMAHNNLGQLMLDDGKVDQAMDHFNRALEARPGYVEALNNLGNAFIEKGQLDTALGQYRTALEREPNSPGSHNNIGYALFLSGKPDQAIAHCRRALELKPGFADAHNNLGLALAGRGQVNEAIAHYNEALRIKPGYAEAYNNLGNVAFNRGQVDEAISLYRKALESNPRYALAHNGLGAALFEKGQVGEAIIHLEKAVELKPGYADARRNLEIARRKKP